MTTPIVRLKQLTAYLEALRSGDEVIEEAAAKRAEKALGKDDFRKMILVAEAQVEADLVFEEGTREQYKAQIAKVERLLAKYEAA